MKKIVWILIIPMLTFSVLSKAQVTFPVNGIPDKRQLYQAFVNAKIWIDYQTMLDSATLIIFNGKVAAVGKGIKIPSGAVINDMTGKTIYPSFIDPYTQYGISETTAIEKSKGQQHISTTRGAYSWNQALKPEVEAHKQFAADEKTAAAFRKSGFGTVLTFSHDVIHVDEGVHVRWPSMRRTRSTKEDAEEKQQQRLTKELEQLKKLFTDAKAYSLNINHEEKNIHLESLRGLFRGTKSLYVHCNFVKEIIAAAGLCSQLGIKMILVGGADAILVASLLRSQQIPVVIVKTHRLPSREDEAINLPYNFPAQLRDAGISFAITAEAFWQVRNLPFHAGTAAAYGLTKEEALQAITASPAKILGIYDRLGSLEAGKEATLIICSGDLLDMKSSKVEMAFIRGKQIDLNNIQSQLNLKFRKKYGLYD